MIYCGRQEDGSWGDIRTLDKLFGAYDDPYAGEDGLGPIASIEQFASIPDHEGVLKELMLFLEFELSDRKTTWTSNRNINDCKIFHYRCWS